MSELKSCDMNLLAVFKSKQAHGRFAGIAPFDEQLRLPLAKVSRIPKEQIGAERGQRGSTMALLRTTFTYYLRFVNFFYME
jgi:hypothetical protein